MPESVEVTRLKQAIEHFEARQPRDLPDGFMEAVENVKKQLGSYAPPGRDTPGARAAIAAGTTGTGVRLRDAAKGPDQPSPGQKAAQGVSDSIREAAQRIVAEHSG